MSCVLGIDIGGTNIKFGVLIDGQRLESESSLKTDAQQGPTAVLDKVVEIIHQLCARYPHMSAIGIGFPAVVNPSSGLVYIPPNMPGWQNFNLLEFLQQRCSLPVVIDNDANVAALAEAKLGVAKSLPHFLYVTLGTGIGGAIISNGNLYRGERGGAGEIGHVIIDMHWEPSETMIAQHRAFRAGVMEEYCGREGILRTLNESLPSFPTSSLHAIDIVNRDVADISKAAENGDACALHVLKTVGHRLGLGIASALSILDLRHVVIGGGISRSHPILLESIHQTLKLRTLASIADEVQVHRAQFEHQAGLIGAALLALHST